MSLNKGKLALAAAPAPNCSKNVLRENCLLMISPSLPQSGARTISPMRLAHHIEYSVYQTLQAKSSPPGVRRCHVLARHHSRHTSCIVDASSRRDPLRFATGACKLATASRAPVGPAQSIDNHKFAFRTRECRHQSPHRHTGSGAHRTGIQLPLRNAVAEEFLSVIVRDEQDHVPVNTLFGGAIQNVKRATIVGEGPHPTAFAGAGGFGVSAHFAREGLAVIRRARPPHAPAGLAVFVGITVPGHVDFADGIRG